MTQPDLNYCYAALHPSDQAILATLALAGTVPGKTRLAQYLREAQIKPPIGSSYTTTTIEPAVQSLQALGLVLIAPSNELSCPLLLHASALQDAVTSGLLGRIGAAIHTVDQVSPVSGKTPSFNYRSAMRVLRLAMLLGMDRTEVLQRLVLCAEFHDFYSLHPYLAICARPFHADLFTLLHPQVQESVLVHLLRDCLNSLSGAAPLEQRAQALLALPGVHNPAFITAYAEHCLLCGKLDQAYGLVETLTGSFALALRSALMLLKGDLSGATTGFEAAIKTYRQASGNRTAVFSGVCGYLHVLALLRSDDAKLKKKTKLHLGYAMRMGGARQSAFASLNFMHDVLTNVGQLGDKDGLEPPQGPMALLFDNFVCYWLGGTLNIIEDIKLTELFQQSESAGFHLISAQAADLLSRTGGQLRIPVVTKMLERAAVLRRQQGMVAMTDWFERQEPWQRQLAALANLNPVGEGSSTAEQAQARLIWEMTLTHRGVSLWPREQKRKGKADWTGGRAVSLKRLSDEAETLDFLTPPDRAICRTIQCVRAGYYGSVEYQLDGNNAMPHLIGHPLVYWLDPTGVRVEIVRGEPELEIKKTAGDTLTLSLQPPLGDTGEHVLINRETPTRLRVIQVTDEHQRIADILGASLKVPARAKEQVLAAIRSISSLITIQSDLDVLPSNVEQVHADPRLHVHLMPHGAGLRVTLLVRPFASEGPYYAPGAGSESVIAEIAGKPLQARRALASEAGAANAVVQACPALRDCAESHGERIVEAPEDCLELLLQLQEQTQPLVIAWPEGEKFKISRELGGKSFSLSIKRELDWFSATGELKVDDEQVIDLQKLLELTSAARGRFIDLGNNQFLALTDSFRRRLDELRAYGNRHGKGVRIHPLAAGALQELAEEAGKLKTDKYWKDHLTQLGDLDALVPVLPSTLQADLRDYQLSGFHWLSRLAHWGVGACLADDMGLGKTLQALALLLSRAPQGPALVVAPTSVCMNWIGEVARFAPSLKVILFGAGDRQQTLTDLQPFDLVVASYGLLQQEAERFSAVQWHTIVLDEAQAIKNPQTKRAQAAMALQGDFRMVCSGTPVENHLGELWSLFRFINPGLLGSLEHFNERYAGPIERLQDAQARNRLRKLLGPFILRRTKSQVLSELPSRTEILRQVQLSTEEAALYEALRREALERLAKIDTQAEAATGAQAGQRHIQILAEIMKLRRACCNPQLVAPALGLPSSKLAAFGELLEELLANRHKALVFSQFVDHLGLIRNYLDAQGVRYQYLDGSTPMAERKVRVDAFQAGEGDVFLISLKAGGTGLNLTAADYVIHMDPWWNPAVEDQASDRAHRIGQTRPVTIYRLVAQDTIEEKIVDLHKHKRALADSLLEGSDLAAKMSADDMLQLLQEEWREELG